MKKLLFVALLACTATMARADQSFSIFMNGLQEVGPNASTATGSGTAFYDSTAGTMSLNVLFSGLSAPASASHIHIGAPGVNGGVILGSPSTPTATSGTIAYSGAPFTAPASVAALLAGNTYFNIHNSLFPGGEIRGQLVLVPEPSTWALLGLGLAGLVWRLRRK